MKTYNPDVLLCLANLSNDEVFTPPQLANEVLDLLPKEIWKDKNAKFLDPCCKTGVFLREITIRLIEGLKDEIPDLQERVNHILTNQVFGIAITELTALTSRRTLYCSKDAHGEFSVCTTFEHPGGNIYYRRIEHDWKDGKCSMCGASQKEFDRSKELETHAYAFIHKPIEELFNMKFDVIIGNPPYQLNDGGGKGSSAMPLYHKFVQKAKELNPRYISMIIPSRWFTGGRGLDLFRKEMLSDRRMKHLVDYPNSKECFPSNSIEGGVCYFLWDKDYSGDCHTITIKGDLKSEIVRPLLEDGLDIFIRDSFAISILRKVQAIEEMSVASIVSPRLPYGIESAFKGSDTYSETTSIKLYSKQGIQFISEHEVVKNKESIPYYKVFIGKAYGNGPSGPYKVINNPILADKNSVCSETYLSIGCWDSKEEACNFISYSSTKFFRFLLFLRKISQNMTKSTYSFIPMQDFSTPWTDAELYEKYGLSQEEIDYIENTIRPMGLPETKEE